MLEKEDGNDTKYSPLQRATIVEQKRGEGEERVNQQM
jgi:hypothetical protein